MHNIVHAEQALPFRSFIALIAFRFIRRFFDYPTVHVSRRQVTPEMVGMTTTE